MNEMVLKLLIEIVIAVLPIVSAFFVRYINVKTNQLKGYMKNKEVETYIDLAVDLINKTVIEGNQTTVEALKESGTFDKAAQEKIFNEVKAQVMRNLTDASKKAILQMYKDLDSFVDNQIQVSVNANKKVKEKKNE